MLIEFDNLYEAIFLRAETFEKSIGLDETLAFLAGNGFTTEFTVVSNL